VIYSSGVVENELGLLDKIKNKWNELDRSRKRLLIGVLVIVVVVLILSLGRGRGQREKLEASPTPKAEISKNVEEWETYESGEGYSFKYPEGGRLNEAEDEGLTFIIAGPSQDPNTEFSDGVYVKFWVEEYGDRNLEGVARERYDYFTESVTAEVKSKLEKVKIGEGEGWVFTFESLGENRMYFLPIDGERYLKVMDRSQDASNSGLEEINELLLSTLQF